MLRGSLSLPAPQAQDRNLDQDQDPYKYPETSVAIIGAACKYAGADSLDQLWTLISTGQVMFSQAPAGRFKEPVAGNFISDVDQFDYGFFGISPREATYMDPQQRIALQVAYQAVQSSEYLASPHPELDVGCYVGVGSSDYEHIVNSHPPTAYSFTGTSRAFISGRISHFFKWTGPSLTLDTACSSSATAIHQACNGIAMGDCSLALAGGVHIMASLPADRNIAAAGMTNSTGPCRPFDADAAGYSRGEGCGFLVLKRLSAALASGDEILGVIAGTAMNQSNASSSITVPVSRSQSDVYGRALSRAALSAADISYVEAHGTGTPRGDPVEYQSIREVFGGKDKVYIGSLKGNIGHTEGASGVAGVLKVLLMLSHGQIPAQAHFARLNPAIPVQDHENHLVIPERLQRWDRKFRAACVNNYGAAGSNAAIIICQPPCNLRVAQDKLTSPIEPSRYPFLISGQSPVSLKRYCAALAQYVEANSLSLAEVASLVARQQNRSLRHRIVFSAASMPELQDHLRRHAQAEDTVLSLSSREAKPIVLVFGGQTGSILHFSKAVYDTCYFVGQHVDKCHAIIQRMGLPGLFPDIFKQSPIDDVVMLHCCLFSIQYACAAAWLDAGLSIHRVIGHSFGQLTALCISGIVTLEDALRLVVGRAQLIRDCWGYEKGCMLSVVIDREGAEALARLEPGIEVACYNGPSNYVLAGTQSAIANVEKRALSSSLRTRRLDTTHGFHSRLMDPILAQYLDLVNTVPLNSPVIPIETCSETSNWSAFTAELVAEHSRSPVYFCDAVQRIERDLGPCMWLEAGSASGAVMLAKQSLVSDSNSLCGLQLGSSNARNPLDSVVDATLELWAQGVSAQCWMYHPRSRTHSKQLVSLPGYQFDTSSHWLSSFEPQVEGKGSPLEGEREDLVSLAHLSHPGPGACSFQLNQGSQRLAHILAGRKVLGGSLWPLALYMEVAVQATALLTPSIPPASQLIRLSGIRIKVPIGAVQLDGLAIRLEHSDMRTWDFSFESDATEHASGTVILNDQRTSPPGQIINYKVSDYYPLANSTAPSISSASGTIAYKLLEKVAEYEHAHRGIEYIRMNDHAATARLHLPKAAEPVRYAAGKTRFNPILIDQFLAVAEIHALSMEDCGRSEVFACSGLDEAMISAGFAGGGVRVGRAARNWSVYVRQSSKQGREIVYDIFASDAGVDVDVDVVNGYGHGHDDNQDHDKEPPRLLALLGVRLLRTSTHALEQIVARANCDPVAASPESVGSHFEMQKEADTVTILPMVASLLHELTGSPPDRILPKTVLEDLGMDSLSIMELKARIGAIFNVHIPAIIEPDRTVETICNGISVAQSANHTLAIAPSRVSHSPFPLTPSSSGSGSASASASSSRSRSGSSPLESDTETQASDVTLSTFTSPSTSTSTSSSTTLANIAQTVSAHLSTGKTLHPSSQLASLGLDSLATLELQSDLQRRFGLSVSLMQLDESATISDLHAMLLHGAVGG
jgi:acyl transferase domain-containing protein